MLFKNIAVNSVWDDSRRVVPGSLFAALDGPNRRGEEFIPQAVEQGAVVILLSEKSQEAFSARYPQVKFVGVADPRQAFRTAVEAFYGRPSEQVRAIGVTGTNGKTTITYFLEAILAAAGKSSGVVGTVNYRVAGKVVPSTNTTPGLLDNQIFLADLRQRGITHAVLEVSSHALHQGRVDLIAFRGALFTNLTGDHIDYHGTMEAYFAAKSLLFTGLAADAYAVINVDDSYGRKLAALTRARVFTYGIEPGNSAEVYAQVHEFGRQGARFDIHFPGGKVEINTVFTGKHNVYNILAAFAAGLGEGFDPQVIKKGIEALKNVPGRLERVDCGQDFEVFIDYAHTDDGLKNVLQALQEVKHKRLIVVFGCGGDRDRTKRPRMGKVACELADLSIITSDNPRGEDPAGIIAEVIPGFTKNNYEVQVDREAAIGRAIELASRGDIILLAGKGHETYQVLKEGSVDFVERDIVKRVVAERAACSR
ncbi:MAG: UDP-N-acetylmuramoyl-L-alanyl-D-glutamate--2,6-diaminopimelate ligase [Candidatus Omnitrophica bacterium]|nr:UDP-N-acetylmuramoyl-L-alanyl-D-glutamate--2,6-diaminopimelate ligase [Candidatus Omnitrophota bacterium]